jgi:anti-sigma factor RsiW
MARERAEAVFDAALDDELSAEDRVAFEAALALDERLRDAYESHRAIVTSTRALGEEPAVDLLAGVQHKLRARSGGRFYRDRFATRSSKSVSLTTVLTLSALFVLAVIVWLAYGAGWIGMRPSLD